MASSANNPFLPLHEGLKRALAQGTGTDLKIKCDLREWSVHKLIVSAWSPFFFRACYGNFKESSEDIIYLGGDDPNAVDAMIHFMYHAELATWLPRGEHEEIGGLGVYVQVCALADKYDVPGLVESAESMFAIQAKEQWKSKEFARAARDIFNSPQSSATTGLRTTVLQVAKTYAWALLEDTSGTFHHVVSTVPTLGVEILRNLALDRSKQPSDTSKFICPDCASMIYIVNTGSWRTGIRWCTHCGSFKGPGEWMRCRVKDE